MFQGDFLHALRKGPVRSADWADFCGSRQSFTGLIHIMRNRGYKIESSPDSLRDEPGNFVVYTLVAEPKQDYCPCCGR